MQTAGLSMDQGPPLSIPLSFFFTAPLAVAAAGLLLAVHGDVVVITGYAPITLLLTHLGTLGFLGMAMFGALFQMAPVIASARVKAVRLGHAVHGLLVAGLLTLALGVLGGLPMGQGIHSGFGFIELAVLIFVAMVGTALVKTPVRSETVAGMRFAVLALLIAAVLGTLSELSFRGIWVLPHRPLRLQVHLSVALLGWVGGLIGSVSSQVLPMFYLAEPMSARRQRILRTLTQVGVLMPIVVLTAALIWPALTRVSLWAALATLPALISVWILHPIWSWQGLRARKRRRADSSLLFWQASFAVAPVLALVSIIAWWQPDPRWKILMIWLAVWGWAGWTVHGMLSRIVPFLVWFHRFSFLIGKTPVPSVRSMLPDSWTRLTFQVHSLTLLLGVVAIVTRADLATRILGVALLLTALLVFRSILHVARQRPTSASG